jgi:hypothetical protein
MSPGLFSEDVVLCPIGHPIGKGDILADDTPVFYHIGGKSVDNVSSPLDFPCTEIVPVVSGFISFHLHGE